MDFLLRYLKRYWYLFIIVIIIITLVLFYYFINNKNISEKNTTDENITFVNDSESIKQDDNTLIYKVDIKGAVKKPGVYEVTDNNVVIDVINMAGGLTSKAYTNNINLSKKVSDEMVIYVYTKSEYQSIKSEAEKAEYCVSTNYDITSCIQNKESIVVTQNSKSNANISSNNNDNISNSESIEEKISINSATLEDLMKLDGIGESKALKIIEYRTSNNGFKSIEEIKNVSGIGEAAFDKIKDNIKL